MGWPKGGLGRRSHALCDHAACLYHMRPAAERGAVPFCNATTKLGSATQRRAACGAARERYRAALHLLFLGGALRLAP